MACLDTFGLADGGLDFANFHNSVLCKFAKLKIFLTEKKGCNAFGELFKI